MSSSARPHRGTHTRSLLRGASVGLVLAVLAAGCDSPTQPGPLQPEGSGSPTEPTGNQPDLSGTYTLTLSASSRCRSQLPEAMWTRTYRAEIAQAGGSLLVTLPSIFPGWDNRNFGVDNTFTGVFGDGSEITFHFQFEEWVLEGSVEEFAAYGTMTATISPTGLSGLWDGYMRGIVTNEDGTRAIQCTATDHGAMFSR